MIKNEDRNNNLITRLVEQFRSKSQYEHFIREIQEKFDVNTYRFQQLSYANARRGYNQLKEKYQNHTFVHAPRSWHENERKLFVWFVLALLKYCKQNHKKIEDEDWQELSQTFFNKDILFLKYQWNSVQKKCKRNQWTEEEDQILRSCDQHIENNNWNEIAKEIFFQTEGKSFKSSKQCRQRWQNHLDNKIKRETWQSQEDLIIMKYVLEHGKKWSKIVEQLGNTRTEHMVKNRFKSLLAKVQNDFKTQKKKVQKENALIQHIIEEIIAKNSIIEKKSELQNGSEGKDVVQNDIPEIKISGMHKKSYVHGVIERNENGEFITQNFSTRSSPAPNIFESRSPAALSFGSGGFLYGHSLFTPQSCTPSSATSDGFGMNNSFKGCTETWNRFFKKRESLASETSMISKFLNCGRREQNLKFSLEYGSLQSGEKGDLQASGCLSNSYMSFLEEKLHINQRSGTPGNGQSDNGEQFTSTLFSNFVAHNHQMSRSEMYEKEDKV